ncbi:MAG: class I SAM-dependent methyltransferase [Candidatus Geothermincolia bacterium]
MGARNRLDMFSYTVRNDVVELLLRLFGRNVRSEIAQAPSGAPGVIIDGLTGIGAMLPHLAKRFPQARIIAVDVDPALLGAVKAHLGHEGLTNFEFLEADARDLPLPACRVDLVNISFGLHELKWLDRELVLGEACRVLRPGGELVVADYRAARGIVRRALLRIYFKFFEPRWIREIFAGGLQKQVEDAGFEIGGVRLDLPLTQLILARKTEEAGCRRGRMKLVT